MGGDLVLGVDWINLELYGCGYDGFFVLIGARCIFGILMVHVRMLIGLIGFLIWVYV